MLSRDPDTAQRTIQDIVAQSEALSRGDEAARRTVLRLCQELTTELEPPEEALLKTFWATVGLLTFNPRYWGLRRVSF